LQQHDWGKLEAAIELRTLDGLREGRTKPVRVPTFVPLVLLVVTLLLHFSHPDPASDYPPPPSQPSSRLLRSRAEVARVGALNLDSHDLLYQPVQTPSDWLLYAPSDRFNFRQLQLQTASTSNRFN